MLRNGDIALDPSARTVTRDGAPVDFRKREFALLAALLERPGTALSKAQLEERLYGWGDEVESNAVEVHVHNLRSKLGADAIRTIRGVGYVIARHERGMSVDPARAARRGCCSASWPSRCWPRSPPMSKPGARSASSSTCS